MPLKPGSSKKGIADNFHRGKMKHPDMPHKQMIAIVLTNAKVKPTAKKKAK